MRIAFLLSAAYQPVTRGSPPRKLACAYKHSRSNIVTTIILSTVSTPHSLAQYRQYLESSRMSSPKHDHHHCNLRPQLDTRHNTNTHPKYCTQYPQPPSLGHFVTSPVAPSGRASNHHQHLRKQQIYDVLAKQYHHKWLSTTTNPRCPCSVQAQTPPVLSSNFPLRQDSTRSTVHTTAHHKKHRARHSSLTSLSNYKRHQKNDTKIPATAF